MGQEDKSYNVVFEYDKTAGGYAGCRFYVPYKSQEDFLKSQRESKKTNSKAIAEGISDTEAQDLCGQVPLRNMVRASVQESIGPDGRVDGAHLEMHLRNLAVLETLKGR